MFGFCQFGCKTYLKLKIGRRYVILVIIESSVQPEQSYNRVIHL